MSDIVRLIKQFELNQDEASTDALVRALERMGIVIPPEGEEVPLNWEELERYNEIRDQLLVLGIDPELFDMPEWKGYRVVIESREWDMGNLAEDEWGWELRYEQSVPEWADTTEETIGDIVVLQDHHWIDVWARDRDFVELRSDYEEVSAFTRDVRETTVLISRVDGDKLTDHELDEIRKKSWFRGFINEA